MNNAQRIEFAQFVATCIHKGRKDGGAPRIEMVAVRLMEIARTLQSIDRRNKEWERCTANSWVDEIKQRAATRRKNLFIEAEELAFSIGATSISLPKQGLTMDLGAASIKIPLAR
jgi:hypothetical protein